MLQTVSQSTHNRKIFHTKVVWLERSQITLILIYKN